MDGTFSHLSTVMNPTVLPFRKVASHLHYNISSQISTITIINHLGLFLPALNSGSVRLQTATKILALQDQNADPNGIGSAYNYRHICTYIHMLQKKRKKYIYIYNIYIYIFTVHLQYISKNLKTCFAGPILGALRSHTAPHFCGGFLVDQTLVGRKQP